MRKKNVLPGLQISKLIVPLITAMVFIALFSSCTATKQAEYFRTLQEKDTTIRNFVANDFESKIVPGDQLSITVSSLSPSEDLIFNSAQGSVSSSASSAGYPVSPDGTVILHRVGKVKAAGLTRKELARQTEAALLPYLKEPIVQVTYLNHKITILGEVSKPQVLQLPAEQISIIDALVLSGDVTAAANRKNITVIREEGADKKVKHLNMEDHSVFTSPWFYLKPNDILLVNKDSDKYRKEQNRNRIQTTLSLIASGISLVIIILDRVIK